MSAAPRAIFLAEAQEKNRRMWAFLGLLVLLSIFTHLCAIAGGYALGKYDAERAAATKAELPRVASFSCKEALRICESQLRK